MKLAQSARASARRATRPTVRKVKLAEQVASQIMAEIRKRGWPVGELLGTEADLISQHQVCRATLGEAVRLVESKGAARMMRGPRGGLIVCAPALDTVVRTIGNYLEYVDTSTDELFEVLQVIETLSVHLAAEAVDERDIIHLRTMAAEIPAMKSAPAYRQHLMDIRLAIADASRNPTLPLLMRVLVRVLTHIVWRHSEEPPKIAPSLGSVGDRVAAMVEAIVAGDASLAEEIVRADLGGRRRWVGELVRKSKVRDTPPALPSVSDRTKDDKAADRITRIIVEDIRRSGLRSGERLGQEVDLMERYGTSRWVIRQAIRALEVHAIVHSKRGQGGGLTVGIPDPAHTVDAAQTYLHATGIPPEAFAELWHGLLGAVAQLAARHATPEAVTQLRLAVRAIHEAPFEAMRDRQNDFYLALAQAACNRVFLLFVLIILRYLANFKVKVYKSQVPSEIAQILEDMVDAVEANDEGLARRLARNYSDIIRGYVTFIDKYTPEAEKAFN